MRCPRCGYTTFEFERCPRCEDIFEGEKVPALVTEAVSHGGFWIRLAAYGVDNVLIFLGTVFLAFVTGLATGLGGITASMTTEDVEMLATAFGFFIGMFTGLFYFTFFVGWCGQTPGKRLFKLKVIQKNGEPMTYGRAFIRYLAYIASFIIAGLGFLMIAVDRKKRGLHDLIAGTLVVKTV